jgi:hypothetical protein
VPAPAVVISGSAFTIPVAELVAQTKGTDSNCASMLSGLK